MLLALVAAVTAQLGTGFAMMARFTPALLIAHVLVGLAAVALTIAEWSWLAGSRAGRYRLRAFVAATSGPAEWSEAAFLAVASITVAFGALLAAIIYLGARMPFATLLAIHQGLAIAVAALYLVHTLFASLRSARTRADKSPAQP